MTNRGNPTYPATGKAVCKCPEWLWEQTGAPNFGVSWFSQSRAVSNPIGINWPGGADSGALRQSFIGKVVAGGG